MSKREQKTKPRIPQERINQLLELRRNASLEKASFGFSTEKLVLIDGRDNGRIYTVDEFCKERPRLHRETWVLPIIDELIAWAQNSAEPAIDT